ncbi:MAG: PLxRFG domain-containing protein, partial [Candidatus Bathyarchaeota archaeon]|nr:PLxRFG domain-containing protein [Candidatus Bathyarchaeota archaeon]
SLGQAFAIDVVSSNELSKGIINRELASLYGNITHELSHAIAHQHIQDIHTKINNENAVDLIRDPDMTAELTLPTEDEKLLYRAIVNDYYQWVADNLNAPVPQSIAAVTSLNHMVHLFIDDFGHAGDMEFLAKNFSSLFHENWHNATIDEFNSSNAETQYKFSFVEYLAEQSAKYHLEGKSGLLDPKKAPFFEKIAKDTKKALEVGHPFLKANTPSLEIFYKTHSLEQQIKTIDEIIGDRRPSTEIAKVIGEIIGDKQLSGRLGEEQDSFNKFMDIGFNILQIAEQNKHIEPLQRYTKLLRLWKNDVNNNLAVAEDRITEWRNLGKKENEQLGRLLLDETIGRKPDGGWLANPRAFTAEEIASYNLSDEALELRSKIKEDFRNSLDQMEEVLVNAKKRIFADDEQTQGREILKVRKEFSEMRKKPYFPLMRFGEYVLQIRANGDQRIDGRDYKDGQLVDYQTFDTRSERNKAKTIESKKYVSSKIKVSTGKQVLPNFSLQGMPLTLLEHLESRLQSHDLSQETRDVIKELKNDALPFKSFRRQFQRRKRVEGYSLDAQRSYANYMSSFSNHIARVKFDHQFKETFDDMQAGINMIMKRDGGDYTKRADILNHMNHHMQYVMNPVNEFVTLRSAAFFWFLGFNVKSAFVNMTQVPLVTYPYLAARYGDARATAQIGRAYGTAQRAILNPDIVDQELMDMISKGMSESWLDESLATELALAASEKNLDKTLPRKMRQKIPLKISQYGSYLFHQVEKYNRHITAIAAYRLA